MNTAIFAKVESQSQPGKFYTIRELPDGRILCDCPRFVFGKRNTECKHIAKYKTAQSKHNN